MVTAFLSTCFMPLISYYIPWKHATCLLLYPMKTCHLSLTIPHENTPLVSYYTPWKHATCLLLYPMKTCHLSLTIPLENVPLVSYYTHWKHATCLLLYPMKTKKIRNEKVTWNKLKWNFRKILIVLHTKNFLVYETTINLLKISLEICLVTGNVQGEFQT